MGARQHIEPRTFADDFLNEHGGGNFGKEVECVVQWGVPHASPFAATARTAAPFQAAARLVS